MPPSEPATLDEDLQRRVDQHRATVEEAYGAYEELRGKCPVAHSDAHGGYYLLTRHADVLRAAMDWKTFSSAKGVNLPPDRTRPQLPAIEHDPPEHAAWRKRYADALTPAAIEAMRPHVERIADELIDRFAGKGTAELVYDYGNPLPVLGISAAIGLSPEKAAQIPELALALTETVANFEEQKKVVGRLAGFILGEIHARRVEPQDDYLTTIAQMEIDGQPMPDGLMALFMIGFLVAGHETTSASLANLIFNVLRDPALKQRVLEDDKALAAAIEESVRLASPFHGFSRTTTAAVEIAGQTIPEDQIVRLCWAAANRDPAVYSNPDAFDIDRPSNPHMGFGWGRHVCAGAGFARLEMGVALRRLLTRLPDIALEQDHLDWRFAGGMMTLPQALNVTFTPKA
jgi:cytochrome P450